MNGELQVAGWRVERNLNRLSRNGKSVQVEPKAMEVLVFLAEHPGEVLSREAILQAVWADTHVCNEVLTYCIFELRKALEDDAKNPQIIQTIPRRGYRLIAPVRTEAGLTQPAPAEPKRRIPWLYIGATALVVAALSGSVYWYSASARALAESDFVLLTDFVNSTGETVFDDTLKHALAMHLNQTPFLNIYPEERVRETLGYMGRPPEQPITREVGREISLRRGIRALIEGSIAKLGNNYVISLTAIDAQKGLVIALAQVEAESKEQVLRKLGTAATTLRQKLGESMGSIGKYDVPLEQATTSSLEAFKAYSTGRKYLISGRMSDAIPHYQRALEHDPEFASAYDDLAWCYEGVAEQAKAVECAKKAFALRGRVSEYERLSIATIYYTLATGEMEKAVETLEMMRTIYPRSAPVHNTLGGRYQATGQYRKAEESFREAIRLTRHPNAYAGLASALLRLNRVQEAKQVIADARLQGIDNRNLRELLYVIATIEGDRATMLQQVQWALGKPDEAFLLALQGRAAASSGHMDQAREYFRQAIATAQNRGLRSAAASFAAEAARWESSCGDCDRALQDARLALSIGREIRVTNRAAMALALCGKPEEAQALADEINADYPTHSLIQQGDLPELRAAIALARDDPKLALQALGLPSQKVRTYRLWSRYLAGESHRRLGDYQNAMEEFQYVVSHRTADSLSPLCALARLGLARAEAAAGNKAKSGRTYQELFALWRDADQDLPLFRRAMVEYSTLRQESDR